MALPSGYGFPGAGLKDVSEHPRGRQAGHFMASVPS